MSTIKSSLTIVYEPPFYKAIFERRFDSTYEVSQVNLGPSEPKLTLIYDLVIHHWNKIIFFKQTVCASSVSERKINPKRLQRLAKKSIQYGVGTKHSKHSKNSWNVKK